MTASLVFPAIDPVAVSLGPLHIRWYALAYLAGFLGGWIYGRWLARQGNVPASPAPGDIDELLPWLVLGVILGGRTGYVLFYNLDYFSHNLARIPAVWEGGMSFHGGLIGVVAVCTLYARKRKLNPLALGDVIAAVAPIGLFFGRLANFVNGELFGRVTTVPWAMVFPNGGPEPRHPSQLYEAGMEGVFLFSLLIFLALRSRIMSVPGRLMGIFLIGYGMCRVVAEYFREPDVQIGYIFRYFSMGQLLSLPMIALGVALLIVAPRFMRWWT